VVAFHLAAQIIERFPDGVDQADPILIALLRSETASQALAQTAQLLQDFGPLVSLCVLAFAPFVFVGFVQFVTQIRDGALQPVQLMPQGPARLTTVAPAVATLHPLRRGRGRIPPHALEVVAEPLDAAPKVALGPSVPFRHGISPARYLAPVVGTPLE
jgi:hypothetical protein